MLPKKYNSVMLNMFNFCNTKLSFKACHKRPYAFKLQGTYLSAWIREAHIAFASGCLAGTVVRLVGGGEIK